MTVEERLDLNERHRKSVKDDFTFALISDYLLGFMCCGDCYHESSPDPDDHFPWCEYGAALTVLPSLP